MSGQRWQEDDARIPLTPDMRKIIERMESIYGIYRRNSARHSAGVLSTDEWRTLHFAATARLDAATARLAVLAQVQLAACPEWEGWEIDLGALYPNYWEDHEDGTITLGVRRRVRMRPAGERIIWG